MLLQVAADAPPVILAAPAMVAGAKFVGTAAATGVGAMAAKETAKAVWGDKCKRSCDGKYLFSKKKRQSCKNGCSGLLQVDAPPLVIAPAALAAGKVAGGAVIGLGAAEAAKLAWGDACKRKCDGKYLFSKKKRQSCKNGCSGLLQVDAPPVVLAAPAMVAGAKFVGTAAA